MIAKSALDYFVSRLKNRDEEKKEQKKRIDTDRHLLGERLLDYCLKAQGSRYTQVPEVHTTKKLASDLEDFNNHMSDRFWQFYQEWEAYAYDHEQKWDYDQLNSMCNSLVRSAKAIRDGRWRYNPIAID
jgi:hypothetical protein